MGPDGVGEVAVDDGISFKPRNPHLELTVPARVGRPRVGAMEQDAHREEHVRQLWLGSHQTGHSRGVRNVSERWTLTSERLFPRLVTNRLLITSNVEYMPSTNPAFEARGRCQSVT